MILLIKVFWRPPRLPGLSNGPSLHRHHLQIEGRVRERDHEMAGLELLAFFE
jgi:hypothetical protein